MVQMPLALNVPLKTGTFLPMGGNCTIDITLPGSLLSEQLGSCMDFFTLNWFLVGAEARTIISSA